MNLKYILKRGGATLNKRLKPARHTAGYYVSQIGGEAVALTDYNTIEQIDKLIQKRAAELPKNAYLGLWVNQQTFYIDVSHHFKNFADAMNYGRANNQLAIWDVANNKSIEVK